MDHTLKGAFSHRPYHQVQAYRRSVSAPTSLSPFRCPFRMQTGIISVNLNPIESISALIVKNIIWKNKHCVPVVLDRKQIIIFNYSCTHNCNHSSAFKTFSSWKVFILVSYFIFIYKLYKLYKLYYSKILNYINYIYKHVCRMSFLFIVCQCTYIVRGDICCQ